MSAGSNEPEENVEPAAKRRKVTIFRFSMPEASYTNLHYFD